MLAKKNCLLFALQNLSSRKLSLFFAITVACGNNAARAVCPFSECDYGDPQYQVAYEKYKAVFDVYNRCIDPLVNSFLGAVDRLAILYPRFGIAYRAMQDEIKAATDSQLAADSSSATAKEADRRIAVAQQRFQDRILHTAEPEALEFFNLYQLKLRQQTDHCGPMPSAPQPPRK